MYTHLEFADLTQKEQKVLHFIREHPGSNKQAVVDGLDGTYSRKTVFANIDSLVSYGMVVIRKDKPNGQNHYLYVNSESIIVSVNDNIDHFEGDFFTFLEAVKEQYHQSYQMFVNNVRGKQSVDISSVKPHLNSIMRMIYIFYEMVDMFMFHSVIVWPKETPDENVLKKLNSIVLTRIVQMHSHLSSILTSMDGKGWEPEMLPSTLRRIYLTKNLIDHVDAFKSSGLETESENLLDTIWKMNNKVAQVAYPEPHLYNWSFNYDKDSWRKLLELHRQYPHQTYPNYVDSLSSRKNEGIT